MRAYSALCASLVRFNFIIVHRADRTTQDCACIYIVRSLAQYHTFLYITAMTLVLLAGSLLITFSPALALFILIITRSSQLVILSLGRYATLYMVYKTGTYIEH